MKEATPINGVSGETTEGRILLKLVLFAISLAFVPIATYFLTLNYLWNGNPTYAAISAVVGANGVLVIYIALSVLEDKGPTMSAKSAIPQTTESKKSQ